MKNENEQLKELLGLVRDVVSALNIKHPVESDTKFRSSLLNKCASEMSGMPIAQVRRLHEAACQVEFPDAAILEFRKALQCVLGKHYSLRAWRTPMSKQAAAQS